MRTLTTSALIITSTLLFTACSTTPTADTKPAGSDTTSATTAAPAAAPVAAAPAPAPAAKPAELNFVPIKRSVFFDYNSFELKSDYTPVVEAHAKYLIANPNKKATIQGNADERG